MTIVERLKHWTGIDQVEDAILLNRYGAKNMDELWTMILMDRTAVPTSYVKMANWRLTIVSHLALEWKLYKKHGFRYKRKVQEAYARQQYADQRSWIRQVSNKIR